MQYNKIQLKSLRGLMLYASRSHLATSAVALAIFSSNSLAAPPAARPATAASTSPAATLPAVREPSKLSLRASPASRPTLQLQLLPPASDVVEGDSVPLYLRVNQFLPDEKATSDLLYPENEKYDYLSTPTHQFPPQYADRALAGFADMLRCVELGARRRDANWAGGWPDLESRRSNPYSYMSNLRHAANVLSFKARVEVYRGNWGAALHTMQTQFGLAKHVGLEPLLIHGLVASQVAENAVGNGVEEWIGREGSPNLYWALADLPAPFVDVRPIDENREVEWRAYLPLLADGIWGSPPAERWPAILRDMVGYLQETHAPFKRDAARVEVEVRKLVADASPRAKAFLLADGVPAAAVGAMTAEQLVGVYLCREYRQADDDQRKACRLPYPQAVEHMRRAWRATAPDRSPAIDNPLIQAVLVRWQYTDAKTADGQPVYERNFAWSTVARSLSSMRLVDREIAAYRAIETLRGYAARHGGRPPVRLEAVTELPVPADPWTGQPFNYKLSGRVATLEAVKTDLDRRRGLSFELSFPE